MGYSRANLFGKNFEDYKEEAQKPLIIAQIEHIKAIENLDEILKVQNLDAILIGPYDVSASMGHTGELKHLDVVNACKKVLEASNITNVPSGIHLVNADETELKKVIESGYHFIAYSLDAVFLNKSAVNPYQ